MAPPSTPTPPPISEVEAEYRRRTFAMPVHRKIERMANMYGLAKSTIARRLTAEHGPMSARRLQLLVARELYKREPQVVTWIEEMLADVSD